jgi:SAM-dependent methyltransferase
MARIPVEKEFTSVNARNVELMDNIDLKTVRSFSDEWSRFDQGELHLAEHRKLFDGYFVLFPWSALRQGAEGFDMGCGSGRWAKLVAPRVGWLHCIDPSEAIRVAELALNNLDNVSFHKASVDISGLLPASQDFGYSLGVLHHVPNTAAAIRSCAELLKPGAPFLLYLYYAFDNRPFWFRAIWRLSDLTRQLIHPLPPPLKHLVTDVIAALVYWPLARLSRLMNMLGLKVTNVPLSFYRDYSFYTMRTDARDRFGTPLEQRFTRAQIEKMMLDAGLTDIRFSESTPYWCAVGIKV